MRKVGRCRPLRAWDAAAREHDQALVRRHRAAGARRKWTYRIGLAANAQSDPAAGGLMLLSPPVEAIVPEG